MLVKVPLIREGWERLHEEIVLFFNNIQTARRWSKKLFEDNFYEQVVLNNPGLLKHLKSFWTEFRKLPSTIKMQVCQEFACQNCVRELCNNKLLISFYWRDQTNSEFVKTTKELFSFMYEKTLCSASFKTFSGQNLKDHYEKFRQEYDLSMCPFCGLEDYIDLHPELDGRDAYDHYFNKADYPFAAINPDNLFPMCSQCNSGHKKAQNVLFNRETGQRRRAPYPADDEFKIEIDISNAFTNPPTTTIRLVEPVDVETEEKYQTWINLLNIKLRYEGRVQKKRWDWLAILLPGIRLEKIEDDFAAVLGDRCSNLKASLDLGPQRELHLEIPFLQYCSDHIDALIGFLKNDPKYTRYIIDRTNLLET